MDYKSLYKFLPLPAIVLDASTPDFTIVETNESFQDVFSRPISSALNKSFFDAFPMNEDDPEGKQQLDSFKKVIETGEPDKTGILKIKEGEVHNNYSNTRYYELQNIPIKNDAGEVEFIIHTIRDITKEKHKAKQLEEKEKRFRSLVENGNDVLFVLDKDGSPTYVSPNISYVLGYSVEQAMEFKPSEILHPHDLPHVMEEIEVALSNPAMPISVTPARMRHKNGSWRWMAGTITNMLHDPAINGIVDNFTDITETVEAEIRLKESNEKFQSLIQSIDGIFWEADAQTLRFNYVSPQVEDILGYTAETWLKEDQFWQHKIHPEDRGAAIQFCHHETAEGRNHEFEYRMQKADGSYIWVRDVVTVVSNDGVPDILRGLIIDITQKKELQAQLDDTYKLAKIGNWELDLIEHTLTWSKYVKELHDVPQDYQPDLESAINFYAEGENRDKISKAVADAVEDGTSYDIELKIITAKQKEKWVRTIGKSIFDGNECVAIYGSTQEITKRKTAEIADRKNRQRLESILDQSIDVICIIDKEGRFEIVSSAAENIWGYTPDELKNRPYMDLVYEADMELTNKAAENIMHGKDVTYFENRYVHKNGDIVPMVWAATWNSKDQRMYATARDARELKKAQKELKATEEQLRNIVENSTNMFYTHNADGEFSYVSPQSEDFLGYKPEETKKRWYDFVTNHPDNQIGFECTAKALETGEVQPPYELQLKKADGGLIWVEINEAPLIKNGETVAIVGSLTDITDRKHYQQELKKSLERYDYVSKASRDAIYDWNINDNDLHWGTGFSSLFGYDTQKVSFPADTWEKMVHPNDKEAVLQDLHYNLYETDKTEHIAEYRLKNANGEFAHVADVGYIIRDDEDNPVRIIGAIRDITESKIVEIQKTLQNDLSKIFTKKSSLQDILTECLGYFTDFGDLNTSEIWLLSQTETHLNLTSSFAKGEKGNRFYNNSTDFKKFQHGEGLPGMVWKKQEDLFWDNISEPGKYVRFDAAAEAGLKSAYGILLSHNHKFVGVLILTSERPLNDQQASIQQLTSLGEFLGAEIKRRQQEEELQLLYESAPEIIAVATQDSKFSKFVRVNPAFCEITGYSEEELTSQPFQTFIHPDDLRDTKKVYDETISGKRDVVNFTNRWRTKSGEYRWISWNSSDLYGEVNLVFAFGRDVTQKVKLEKLLQQTSELAKIGSWEMNLREGHKTHYWSETARNIVEVGEDYSPSLPDNYKFYTSESKAAIKSAIEDALQSGKSFDLVLEIKTAKGNQKWVRCIGDSEFENGTCIRLFGSSQDVTDKVVAELERVRILESISDAFYALNSDWEFTYYNSEAENLLNTAAEEVMGKNIWDIFKPARESELYSIYHNVVEEKTSRTFEYYYPPVEAWLEVNAYYHDDGLSVFFRNINERKEAQENLKLLNAELQSQTKELAVSNAELEQFAYVASHDLQEPLRMVSSFLTQLDKKYHDQLDEKAHQYIHFAVDGAQRMRQIILDLLNYSRIEKNNEFKEVDLNNVVQNALKAEQSTIKEKKAIIEFGEFPTVYGVETPLQQVFQNLLNNALKYQKSQNTPQIRLTAEEGTDSHWMFSVADNGIGIDAEFRESIFNIFQRLHTRDEYAGTGIGLAIAKKIIDQHNGKIWVESNGESGCKFYFTIGKRPVGP